MSSDLSQYLVTVVVPTFNGEEHLAELLDAVLAQELDGAVDVLVIDSGSTDKTLDIVRERPSVRLHEIPNSEFGHGKTRNLGVAMSQGEFTAFLTHDAVPSHPLWLKYLLSPMRSDKRVAAVLGPQRPRVDCFPLLKYEMGAVFGNQGSIHAITIYSGDLVRGDEEAMRHAAFFSDVNGAIRTDVVRNHVPYRDIAYAEDQMLGADLLNAGYWKAFAPRAEVIHSNSLTLREYRKRMFDETLALRKLGLATRDITFVGGALRALKGTVGDSLRIIRDSDFGPVERVKWLCANPAFQVVKWSSMRHAMRVDVNDEATRMRYSLEEARRAAAMGAKADGD